MAKKPNVVPFIVAAGIAWWLIQGIDPMKGFSFGPGGSGTPPEFPVDATSGTVTRGERTFSWTATPRGDGVYDWRVQDDGDPSIWSPGMGTTLGAAHTGIQIQIDRWTV